MTIRNNKGHLLRNNDVCNLIMKMQCNTLYSQIFSSCVNYTYNCTVVKCCLVVGGCGGWGFFFVFWWCFFFVCCCFFLGGGLFLDRVSS